MLRPASGQFTDEQRNIIEEIANSINYATSPEAVASEEPIIELTLMDYILTFAPIITLMLIIGSLVLILKKKRKKDINP